MNIQFGDVFSGHQTPIYGHRVVVDPYTRQHVVVIEEFTSSCSCCYCSYLWNKKCNIYRVFNSIYLLMINIKITIYFLFQFSR